MSSYRLHSMAATADFSPCHWLISPEQIVLDRETETRYYNWKMVLIDRSWLGLAPLMVHCYESSYPFSAKSFLICSEACWKPVSSDPFAPFGYQISQSCTVSFWKPVRAVLPIFKHPMFPMDDSLLKTRQHRAHYFGKPAGSISAVLKAFSNQWKWKAQFLKLWISEKKQFERLFFYSPLILTMGFNFSRFQIWIIPRIFDKIRNRFLACLLGTGHAL